MQRVENTVMRELSAIINRNLVFDEGMVTIHEVSITPDLRQAHIYLGVMPSNHLSPNVISKLEENRVMLQSALSKRVVLKYTPHLNFHLDESVERGVRVVQLMQDLPVSEDDDELQEFEPTLADDEGPLDLAADQKHPDLPALNVPAFIKVRDLAAALSVTPFRLVSELVDLGVMANLDMELEPEVLEQVCARFGFRFESDSDSEQ